MQGGAFFVLWVEVAAYLHEVVDPTSNSRVRFFLNTCANHKFAYLVLFETYILFSVITKRQTGVTNRFCVFVDVSSENSKQRAERNDENRKDSRN